MYENILDRLLEFENTSNVLKFEFHDTKIKMWPYIRNQIFNEILFDGLDVKKQQYTKTRNWNVKKLLKYLLITVTDLFKPYKKKEILFITSNIYNTAKVNGKYYNWLYDEYANLFIDNTQILERSHNLEYKRPRYIPGVKTYDHVFIKTKLLAKFRKTTDQDRNQIRELLKEIEAGLTFVFSERVRSNAEGMLLKMSRELKGYILSWDKIIKKISPKLIFVDDGSYGLATHIYDLAHGYNIICCEFQHGGANKVVYHQSESIINDKTYKNYLPDYYLTFGKYWNSYLKSSTKAVVIGNPKMTTKSVYKKKREEMTNKVKKTKTLLFISTSDFVDNMFNIIRELVLRGLDKEYRIIIRPHPSDYYIIEKYISFGEQYGIEVQRTCSIEEALSEADAIISEVSTVIYEALMYEVKIFILNTRLSEFYMPEGIGIWFNNADALLTMLNNTNWDKNTGTKYDRNDIFCENWEQNYRDFINQLIS